MRRERDWIIRKNWISRSASWFLMLIVSAHFYGVWESSWQALFIIIYGYIIYNIINFPLLYAEWKLSNSMPFCTVCVRVYALTADVQFVLLWASAINSHQLYNECPFLLITLPSTGPTHPPQPQFTPSIKKKWNIIHHKNFSLSSPTIFYLPFGTCLVV